MGYFKSSRLGIETPEPSNPPAITSDLKKLGAQLDELITNPLLIKEHATSVPAASGELVKATGAITVTSPTTANGAVFGVLANGHEVKIKAASGKIYGDFIEGATEVTLTGYQHLALQSDGTNWYIIAGEPKREQAYSGFVVHSRAECHAGFVPNVTRPVLLQIKLKAVEPSIAYGAKVEVEGKSVGYAFLTVAEHTTVGTTITVYVPAGQTVKIDKDEPVATELAAAVSVEISTLVL